MTASEVLAEARATGVVLSAGEVGKLRWKRPGGGLPARLKEALAAHKAELLSLIRQEEEVASLAVGPAAAVSSWDLPPELFERWEERVCIMHFDGGLPWPRAEAEALADVLSRPARRLTDVLDVASSILDDGKV